MNDTCQEPGRYTYSTTPRKICGRSGVTHCWDCGADLCARHLRRFKKDCGVCAACRKLRAARKEAS